MRALLALAAALVGAAVVGTAPAGIDLYTAACESSLSVLRAGTIRSPRLDEVSGVVASRSRPGILWVANDSGDRARVYAITLAGRLVQTVSVRGADAVDWEDLARGPGSGGGDDLYAADIGDNDAARRTITVYRFPEPGRGASTAQAQRITLRYPTGPRDAEALLVDPRRGTLLVLTKALGRSELYEAPPAGGTLRRVGSIATLAPVTGADVAERGELVAVRTYLSVLLWRRPPGKPLWAAFTGRSCPAPAPPERQGEAIAFARRGAALVTVGEGREQPVYLIRGRQARARL